MTLPDDAVKTTFHEYDNLFEWMVDSNGYRLSATGLSTFAWVGIGKESFILPSVQAGNFHKIEMIPGPGPGMVIFYSSSLIRMQKGRDEKLIDSLK